jgi:hypothetical protein
MMTPLPCDLLGGAVSSSSPRSPQQIIAQGNARGYEKFVVIFSPLNSMQCLTPLKRLSSHTIYTGAAGDEPCSLERRGGSKPWMKTTPQHTHKKHYLGYLQGNSTHMWIRFLGLWLIVFMLANAHDKVRTVIYSHLIYG